MIHSSAPVAKHLPGAAAGRRRAQALSRHPRLFNSRHSTHGKVASCPQQRLAGVAAAQRGGASRREAHCGIVAAQQEVLCLILCRQGRLEASSSSWFEQGAASVRQPAAPAAALMLRLLIKLLPVAP